MRLKEFEIFEAATAGATTSGNIATVANPHVAHSKQKPKKVKPTDNALDMDVPLLSSKTPATIRRQIQEGSLYKNEELVEFKSRNWNSNNTIEKVFPGFGKNKNKTTPWNSNNTIEKVFPGFGKNKNKTTPSFDDIMKRANSFDDLMKQRSKDSAIVNTEKSKRQTAKAAGYDAIMKGKDISKIAKPDANSGMKDGDYKTPPSSKRTPKSWTWKALKAPKFKSDLYRDTQPAPKIREIPPKAWSDPSQPTPKIKGSGPKAWSKLKPGFEYDPESSRNMDPGFDMPNPGGGKNLDPGFNSLPTRLDKKLKKQLGGRKPL